MKALNSISNFYNGGPSNSGLREDFLLKQDLLKTKEFLKEHDHVIVMRSDKGGATVVMNRDEYYLAMSEMLSDQTIYKKSKTDPTSKYQMKINKLVKRLVEDEVIDDWMGKSLKTVNGLPPRLYGLRKVHKAGCKMRPVVSCIKSPCYKVAKFLHTMLTPVIDSVHPKIQFTMEKEVDNKLPFLDTVVFRLDSGELRTNWYQKPSCSGRLLNFNSHHPIAHKISVVLGLMFRAFRLSHADFYEENLLQVRDILHRNNYPRSFIDVCLRRFENLHKNRDSVNIKTQENRFRFPFIRGLSRYISLSFRSTDWRPAFYNIRTVSEVYSKLKDKTVWNQESELVYSIPCSCGKAYVGQTKQYLSRRIYQHKYSCQDKFRDKEDLTALALHHF
ncbi:uncharacterized protein LOC141537171 [Cotesia typhae]|uniref:uncharacterized protein LOC141537171 n=1 Tax=Cotesia typhae TaxID=2053667 RepID=UPI003D681025